MNKFTSILFLAFVSAIVLAALPCILEAQDESVPGAVTPVPDMDVFAASILDAGLSNDELKEAVLNSVILEFVKTNRSDVIESLVQRDIALDQVIDSHGNSLLHIAAAKGFPNHVKTFLAQGSFSIDRTNDAGRTPLFLATNGGFTDVAKQLIDAGADVNGKSDQRPLNSAAWYDKPELAQLLLAGGADVTLTDSDGNTPLHKAVWQSNRQVVRHLLDAGSDVDVENNAGLTPTSLANSHESKPMDKSTFRAWGPEHVLFEPDAGDGYSEFEWCPQTINETGEWVDVSFDDKCFVEKIQVYIKPGSDCLESVSVFDDAGKEVPVWKKGDPIHEADGHPAHVAEIRPDIEFDTRRVRVYVRMTDWIYCDAIALIDVDRNTQWASWATASSTYAGDVTLPDVINQTCILEMLEEKRVK